MVVQAGQGPRLIGLSRILSRSDLLFAASLAQVEIRKWYNRGVNNLISRVQLGT